MLASLVGFLGDMDLAEEADRPVAGMDDIDVDDSTIPDERLELIFTCCHPAPAVPFALAGLHGRLAGGHPDRWHAWRSPPRVERESGSCVDQANVTERGLLPGLDGLAAWLRRYDSPAGPRHGEGGATMTSVAVETAAH